MNPELAKTTPENLMNYLIVEGSIQLTIPKDGKSKGIKPFTDYLIKIIKTINRGSGITLFVDSSPLTTIDSRLVLNLKMYYYPFLQFQQLACISL